MIVDPRALFGICADGVEISVARFVICRGMNGDPC